MLTRYDRIGDDLVNLWWLRGISRCRTLPNPNPIYHDLGRLSPDTQNARPKRPGVNAGGHLNEEKDPQ